MNQGNKDNKGNKGNKGNQSNPSNRKNQGNNITQQDILNYIKFLNQKYEIENNLEELVITFYEQIVELCKIVDFKNTNYTKISNSNMNSNPLPISLANLISKIAVQNFKQNGKQNGKKEQLVNIELVNIVKKASNRNQKGGLQQYVVEFVQDLGEFVEGIKTLEQNINAIIKSIISEYPNTIQSTNINTNCDYKKQLKNKMEQYQANIDKSQTMITKNQNVQLLHYIVNLLDLYRYDVRLTLLNIEYNNMPCFF